MSDNPGNIPDDANLVFWQTQNEQLSGVGTDSQGTFERSLPQQNAKDTETGDHYFYDPRDQRSGMAGGDRS